MRGKCSGEQLGGFAGFWEDAVADFFPEELVVAADFEDAAASRDEGDGFSGRLGNFSRHTVGFRAEVSLVAIFDLDRHGGNMNDSGQSAT
jgi:hypothetical protein